MVHFKSNFKNSSNLVELWIKFKIKSRLNLDIDLKEYILINETLDLNGIIISTIYDKDITKNTTLLKYIDVLVDLAMSDKINLQDMKRELEN